MKPLLIKFLCIRFLSTFGDQMLLFVMPLLVYKATNSIALSGLAFFIEWMPRVLSLPFAGIFSDKFGGKLVYIIGDFSRSLLCILAFASLYLMPGYSFYILSILMALCAICYAQTFIAQETTIPLIVKSEYIHKAQSIVQSIEQVTVVMSPLICSFLSYYLPIKMLLIFTAIIFFISSLSMCLLTELPVSKTCNSAGMYRDITRGLNIIINSKELLWLCLMTVCVNLIWGLSLATGAAVITGAYGKSAAYFGYVQSAVGMACILFISAVYIIINRVSIKVVGLLSCVLICVGSMLIGFGNIYILFLIGYVLTLSLDGVFNVFIRTERLKIIPKEHVGKTIGLLVLINQLSVPLAGLLVARYSVSIGVNNIYLLVGFLTTLVMMLYFGSSYTTKKYNKNLTILSLVAKTVRF